MVVIKSALNLSESVLELTVWSSSPNVSYRSLGAFTYYVNPNSIVISQFTLSFAENGLRMGTRFLKPKRYVNSNR